MFTAFQCWIKDVTTREVGGEMPASYDSGLADDAKQAIPRYLSPHAKESRSICQMPFLEASTFRSLPLSYQSELIMPINSVHLGKPADCLLSHICYSSNDTQILRKSGHLFEYNESSSSMPHKTCINKMLNWQSGKWIAILCIVDRLSHRDSRTQ